MAADALSGESSQQQYRLSFRMKSNIPPKALRNVGFFGFMEVFAKFSLPRKRRSKYTSRDIYSAAQEIQVETRLKAEMTDRSSRK
jgi:hypothetical protein